MINVACFLLCATIIFFAGKKLSFYGDVIAGLTGWGKAWVGIILLATVTSLPELMVGVSSSAIIESADLAVGDILGSCAFNLGILAMMDVFVPRHKSLLGMASQSNILAASMGIVLIAMTGVGLFLPKEYALTPGIGLVSLLFIVMYLVSVRLIYKFDIKTKKATVEHTTEQKGAITLKRAVTMYSVFAVVTIVAALFLPHFAEQIAEFTGLGKTFVGTLLLAVSTSLPEIAASIAAVRMGSVDLSVGNLLGSNLFNVFILALDDFFYTRGQLLKDASEANLISVFSTIVMSAIVVVGLTYHAQTKRSMMALDALLIAAIYIINLLVLYNLT